MFKKKFSYLLFVLFLFSFFRLEVNAKALSCFYTTDSGDVSYKVVQKKDGKGAIYVGQKSKTLKEDGTVIWNGPFQKKKNLKELFWYSGCAGTGDYSKITGTKLSGDSSGSLKSCPKYLITSDSSTGFYFISDINKYNEFKKNTCVVSSNYSGTYVLKKSANKAYSNNTKVGENESTKDNNKPCSEISKDDMWINKDSGAYASCLYSVDLDKNKGCVVVQLDFSKDGAITYDTAFPTSAMNVYNKTGSDFNSYYMEQNTECSCPANRLQFSGDIVKGDLTYELNFGKIDADKKWKTMNFVDSSGKNLCDPTKDMTGYTYDGYNLKFIFDEDITCADIIGEDGDLVDLLNTLVKLTKILVPVLLIVFGSLDFAKAIFSGDESGMKKAQSKFVKRLIISIAFFIAPTILKFILEIGHSIWDVVDADLCGIL